MALPPQQFCVRWNSYHTNLQSVFPRLLLTEQFADVTLACESRQLRCHKLVLSACSAYLERLLLQNPCKHPIVLMRDMRFSEMQALVDFMYKGEVNVTQEELPSLLKSAEALQIRGLCSSDNTGLSSELGPTPESKDFTVASEALLANAHRENTTNGPTTQQTKPTTNSNGSTTTATTTNGTKKRKSEESERNPEVKEETVEEDGLYYGELDNENIEYNEEEDSGKPGSSLGQTSGRRHSYIRVKPESELLFQTKLQNLSKANSEYINKLSKMNATEIQNEFSKYGLNTNNMASEETYSNKNAENDFYKSWLEQNGELEVSLLKANQIKKPKTEIKSQKSEVELIPKPKADNVGSKEFYQKVAEKPQIRRRGRPPIFKDKNMDIGDTVLKSDLDQFLEGKEVSSSGLSRKDLERVMMGKFNPNRRYSNEAMWAALMDVKKGGSIYRAAQTHKVPRKSLRNWMKRCHIKSSFPMPQQLKQFVENSKKQREYKTFDGYPNSAADGHGYGEKSGAEDLQAFDNELDFGKHFLSFAGAQVSSEDEIRIEEKSTEAVENNSEDEFAIANVQCQYDSPSDNEPDAERPAARPPDDHTYDLRDEPPAFIIQQVNNTTHIQTAAPFVDVRPKIMTIGPGYMPGVNVIHVGDRPQVTQANQPGQASEYNINKRIRRSEVVLRQAADCVSRGLTFQTVSEQFNIPISTIRFFMARKGILPRRRRGRSAQLNRTCNSPEPPFAMQHFKLPDMMALRAEEADTSSPPDLKLQ